MIALVADDVTGACDAAVHFRGAGRVQVGLWPRLPVGDLACAAVSTDARERDAATAYRRSRSAASRVSGHLVYRKLDSMLRGHPLADIRGVLAARGGACLLAPALPAEGRITQDGVQRWPGGEIDLRKLMAPLGDRVEVRDATSDADLDAVAQEVLGRGDRLPAGTAGLAAALARALGVPAPPALPNVGSRRPLAVVGTPAARAQAEHAQAGGWAVQFLDPGQLPELGDADSMLLTGGETAARVLLAYGVEMLDLLGEVVPRLPLARACGGRLDGWPVVLKSGSFGRQDAISRALEVLCGRPA